MADKITIEAITPGLDVAGIEIVVTLPTFRRPDHLLRTLASLAVQTIDVPFAVIVMENDAEGRAGLTAAKPIFESGELPGLLLIAHERGNCAAYNAGWSTALERFPAMRHLLVIDDDEIASPTWVAAMVETATRYDADLVGGPQIPVFEEARAQRFARHPVFEPHYASTGPVPVLFSSGNLLVRRHVLETMKMPFLDPAFNFIGGGDSDFHVRCRAHGFRFAWCSEAAILETIPSRRAEFSWLQARALREGALSSIIERRGTMGRLGQAKRLAKSAALLAASPLRALALGADTRSAVIGLYPMQVAVGRFMAEFGIVNEQYRSPEQN